MSFLCEIQSFHTCISPEGYICSLCQAHVSSEGLQISAPAKVGDDAGTLCVSDFLHKRVHFPQLMGSIVMFFDMLRKTWHCEFDQSHIAPVCVSN